MLKILKGTLYALLGILFVMVFLFFIGKSLLPGGVSVYQKDDTNNVTLRRDYANPSINPKGVPFFLEHTSSAYTSLYSLFLDILPEKSGSYTKTDHELANFYQTAYSFYSNKENIPIERAYALNMINYIYILYGLKSEPIKTLASSFDDLSQVYSDAHAHFEELRNANKNTFSDTLSGVMFNQGNVYDNFAAQSVVAEIDKKSFDTYKNSYAFFRAYMNQMQLNILIFSNIYSKSGRYTNFTDYALKQNIYSEQYLNQLEAQIKDFEKNNTLYENTYISSFEIDNMIIENYLWPKYQYAKSREDTATIPSILSQIVEYTSHMQKVGIYYNPNNDVFYPFILSAVNLARVSHALSQGQASEDLMGQARSLLTRVLTTNKNPTMDVWIQNFATTSNMYTGLSYIAQADVQTKALLNKVANNRF